jgi:hypothetical protein
MPKLKMFAAVVLEGGVRNMAKADLAALSRSLVISASLSLSCPCLGAYLLAYLVMVVTVNAERRAKVKVPAWPIRMDVP